MKKIILGLCLFLLLTVMLNAIPVDQKSAEKAALNWARSVNTQRNDLSIISGTSTKSRDNLNLYYTFNFKNGGFIIISADDNIAPVLGYSFTNKADEGSMSPATQKYLKNYEEQINFAITQKYTNSENQQKWNNLITAHYTLPNTRNVAPLLQTVWDQGELYNTACPIDPAGPDGHVWAGCVATAMGQIMKYWSFPTTGTGYHEYYHPVYGYMAADFASTVYDWYGMPNQLSDYNQNVANLLYHIGISVEMNYSPEGSGAYSYMARDALVNYFHYNPQALFTSRALYDDLTWTNIIKNQLDNNKPVYYDGEDATGTSGHAFVCDGYQNDDYFHFNWGWSGVYNGYFLLSSLTPGTFHDYSYVQSAIIDIIPDYTSPNEGFLVYEGVSGGSGYSGTWVYNHINNNRNPVTYTNNFPESLIGYDFVFMSFGNIANNKTVFTDQMALTVLEYLESGGKVFLEGGDALGLDQAYNSELLMWFGLSGTADGATNPIDNLYGAPGSLAENIMFTATSQTALDAIDGYLVGNGIPALIENEYGVVGVQNINANGARTFCFSYCYAELIDGESPNTRDDLGQRFGLFFGIGEMGDEYEPDNDFTQAHDLYFDQSQHHTIYPVGDQDFMKFEVLNAPVNIHLQTFGQEGDTRMWLFDSSQNELAYSDDSSYSLFSEIFYSIQSNGWYYVLVNEFNDNDLMDYNVILNQGSDVEIIAPTNLQASLNPVQGTVDLSWMHGQVQGFYEDFDDGIAQNFSFNSNEYGIGNGYLNMYTQGNNNWFCAQYNQPFSDCLVEFEAMRTQSEGTLGNTIGLFIRSNGFLDYTSGTSCGYLISVSWDGSYSAWLENNGYESQIIPWTASPYINTGLNATNIITVMAFGSSFRIYANGEFLGGFVDETFPQGLVNLCTYNAAGYENQVLWNYVGLATNLPERNIAMKKYEMPKALLISNQRGSQAPLNNGALTQHINPLNRILRNRPQTRDFMYFKIYRNNELLTMVNGTNWTDGLPQPGYYDYFVTAYYDEGESAPSNNAWVEWTESTTVQGYVTNALTGQPIYQANVSIAGINVQTDENGFYSISNIPAGNLQVHFSASPLSGDAPLDVQFYDLSAENVHVIYANAANFYDYQFNHLIVIPDNVVYHNITLSPTVSAGSSRFVINWGADPRDLDSHLQTPNINGQSYHVYYSNRGNLEMAPYAYLDVDDVDGFGPETMTIGQLFQGTYHYYIHKYAGEGYISTSNATINIYSVSGLTHTINAPTNGTGNYWHVLDIDGSSGAITFINQILDYPPVDRDQISQHLSQNATVKEQAPLLNNTRKLVQNLTPSRTISNYYWDFGDGYISQEQNPVHTYQYPGSYNVYHSVSNEYTGSEVWYYNYINVTTPTPHHFIPIWSGNGFQHMNFYVLSADIDGQNLYGGDEIAVFDGDLCVGAVKLDSPIMNYVTFVASMDDPVTPEIDGYQMGHPVSFKIWRASDGLEFAGQQIVVNYLEGQGIYNPGATASVMLSAQDIVTQGIYLSQGWNIMSINTLPPDLSIESVFYPLLYNGTLVKIQNEMGNAFEYINPLNTWVNNIGPLSPSEGYYVRLTNNDYLELSGNRAPLPMNIPLRNGWNVMGYPYHHQQDAYNTVYPLIWPGYLIKVLDQYGNAIEWLPYIGWINNIGYFNPGQGYAIRVSGDVNFNYPEIYNTVLANNTLSSASRREVINRNLHFAKNWSGNGYHHFNVYVLMNALLTNHLQNGDEIAIFDGGECVGATAYQTGSQYLAIPISQDDPSTPQLDGYQAGHSFNIKIWKNSTQSELINLPFELISGSASFDPGATGFIQINSLVSNSDITKPKFTDISSIYPNPFNPTTKIQYSISEGSAVEIEVFNIKGQKVTTLISQYHEPGNYEVMWQGKDRNGRNVGSGVYFCKLKTNSKQIIRKMVMVK